MAGLLSRGRDDPRGRLRLDVPPGLSATLGHDAVGLPARHGHRLLSRLPRTGCVYSDTDWMWWIVPAGSDQDLAWPLPAYYSPGAYVPAEGTRLIHWPEDSSPYTPPIPLYLMVCQITGVAPAWARHGTRSTQGV
ncbi:hypothetical protein [Streptomyces sp. WMMC940]|uniref:hypothetical protein n=1 Tax=Streptomyces sp. WMMC940 TaxID=3015153 RepID=UPI0022B689CA|nr:hypothetical protein [Streptomyces sp. WMMC940]MCZ7456871.1 hypothetical protein [Streptomyces sp. WMMC940]